jgi:hypothetical protein
VRLYFIDDKHDIFCSSVMHIKKIARCWVFFISIPRGIV